MLGWMELNTRRASNTYSTPGEFPAGERLMEQQYTRRKDLREECSEAGETEHTKTQWRGEFGSQEKIEKWQAQAFSIYLWGTCWHTHNQYSYLDAFFKCFILKKILQSQAVIRHNTERFHVPFTQFPPRVTAGITTAQDHNQDIDIDAIYYQQSCPVLNALICECVCAFVCVYFKTILLPV